YDDLDDSDPANDIPKLTHNDGTPTFSTAQEFAERLATILGLDPAAIGANYDSATKELTFDLALHRAFSEQAPLDLGFELDEGLAGIEASTDASIAGTLDLAFKLGVDLDY